MTQLYRGTLQSILAQIVDLKTQFLAGGGAMVGYLRTAVGAVTRTLQDLLAEDVRVKDFGAKVDGVTDDLAAWLAAIAHAKLLGGGVVSMPAGVSGISQQLALPGNVRIRGKGRRGSSLKALAGFVGASMVRLGDGTDFAFDSRVEEMALDCNGIVGTGIFSTDAQEGSGGKNVLVTRYTAYGINFDETQGARYCDHFLFDDIELYCASTAVGSIGFHYKGLKNGGQIRRVTVNAAGAAVQNYGVHIEGTAAAGCRVKVDGLNVEVHQDAVFVDANGGAIVDGVTLITSGTNVVRIASDKEVIVRGAYRAQGTNTINNTTVGEVITDQHVAAYTQVWSGLGIQTFYQGGRSATTPSVGGADNPVHTVKTYSTATGTQQCQYRLLDGLNDGWKLKFSGNGLNDPFDLVPITAGADGTPVFRVTDLGGIQSLPTVNGPTGTFTLGAGASTQVANTSVTANSLVLISPANAAAAQLTSKRPYHDKASNLSGGSFTVKTGDGTAAAGTETFNYWVVN